MPNRHTTLSKFIIDDLRRSGDPHPDLASLLNDIQTACKHIAVAVSRGALNPSPVPAAINPPGERQKPLAALANDIMIETLEWSGQLASMVSKEMENPYEIPMIYPRGRYLLLFDPLDGSTNIDVNMPVGTLFSVLRCPAAVAQPRAEDFLQPGTAQVAAGFALYGPMTMMVITLGAGTHGFTLDPEIGAFTLTHPNMSIPRESREFAVDVSNERFWEPPVRRYVEECIEGAAGPRKVDFNMRWIASMVAEVHRILIRGGLFMYPRDTRDKSRAGRLRLMYEANPMAMIVEQAGGGASTGREPIMTIRPTGLHQRVGVILGSRDEVERLVAYHAQHDRGDETVFDTPLFNVRSLFRSN